MSHARSEVSVSGCASHQVGKLNVANGPIAIRINVLEHFLKLQWVPVRLAVVVAVVPSPLQPYLGLRELLANVLQVAFEL